MSKELIIDGQSLTTELVLDVALGYRRVVLSKAVARELEQSRHVLEKLIEAGKIMYGVNTGFGRFAEINIPADEIKALQMNIVLSHAAGVGEPLPDFVVRAIMLIKANSLASGYSGVRSVVIQSLLNLLNHRIHPMIPSRGSVGASGDLAPLAHMALTLLGEGKVRVGGRVLGSLSVLKKAGLRPLTLEAKEGLALLNGTQAMNGSGILAWARARNCYRSADIIGALSVEGLCGSRIPFDPRIHQARGQKGQIQCAANLYRLLESSSILENPSVNRVQEAYSLRCMPQVHGAGRDVLDYARSVLEIELNAVTDNPLVFSRQQEVLSGGNFHGEPLAYCFDAMGIALSGLSSISERRIAYLMDSHHSGLPGFLATRQGVDSGFMIPQVTAAALASENKGLAHPASVDSIPTSANQEDYVSMGMNAVNKLWQIIHNTETILGVEILAACQAVDCRKPSKPSPLMQKVHEAVRRRINRLGKDRFMAPDMETAADLVRSGTLVDSLKPFTIE
ncbi:MAG TPA: histidine ammonia-lyase [bacterium]|nr:histidine ammonia-lyase [bacterium]